MRNFDELIDKIRFKNKLKIKLGYWKIKITKNEYSAIIKLYGSIEAFVGIYEDFSEKKSDLRNSSTTAAYFYKISNIASDSNKNKLSNKTLKEAKNLITIIEEKIKFLKISIGKISLAIKDISTLTGEDNTELLNYLKGSINTANDIVINDTNKIIENINSNFKSN